MNGKEVNKKISDIQNKIELQTGVKLSKVEVIEVALYELTHAVFRIKGKRIKF